MREGTTIAIFIGIVIFLIILMVLVDPCSFSSFINKKSNKLFEYTPTEKVLRIWRETSLTTDINSEAFEELERRGYWEERRQKAEIESIEIYNKYK